uniref:NADH dehydrogenase subunit 2 n=1 Tax=Timomenus komarovi TaxID=1301248 RepID=UPI0030FE724B|nr:NADH dehydrogenase subunit 2 [Timomenus komarovi]
MLKGLYKIWFMMLMMLGSMVVLHATSWFNAWVGLELNMLSFLPLMIRGGESLGAEAGLKYFLIQAVASLIMLVSVLVEQFLWEGGEESLDMIEMNEPIMMWGVGLTLAMKLGMAPVHFWFPSIAENLTWNNLAILLTWQKMAPLKLMGDLEWGKSSWGLNGLIIISLCVGGIGGILQTSLTSIMAYSSITHMGWMGGGMKLNGEFWMVYLMIYSLLSLTIIWVFYREGCYKLSHLWLKSSLNPLVKLSLFMMVLSLGGLPPFLGFYPKWIVITGLLLVQEKGLSLMMVLITLVTLYYYFRMAFVIYMHMSSSVTMEKERPEREPMGWMGGGFLVGLNFCGLGLGLMMVV